MAKVLKVTDLIGMLKLKFPGVSFYNSTINGAQTQCIGIYRRTAAQVMAIGGSQNSSYDVLPVSFLVHWSEDGGLCEDMANSIYAALRSTIREATPAGVLISHIQLPESTPAWVGRDSKNIAENVIRANIVYQK